MDDKNYDFLKDQLLKTGFGATLNAELGSKMAQGQPEFQLTHKVNYGTDSTTATLHFKKGTEKDMYFFNSYDMRLNKEGSDDAARQTFYINRGNTITAKEAYNLLDGRAVHKTLTNKEQEKYQAWVQLDFNEQTEKGNHKLKQFHQNFGYDLVKNLEKFPIKEMEEAQSRERLVKSLEKGNLQQVTLLLGDKEQKVLITPNVEFKALTAFDEKMQKISLTKLVESHTQVVTQELKQVAQNVGKENKQQQTLAAEKPKHRQRQKQKVG